MSLHDNLSMRLSVLIPICLAVLAACSQQGKVEEVIIPGSGLSKWQTIDEDFSLELAQLVPDFVRAVFESKGLPKEVIDAISSYCVFGTIIRNKADVPIAYDLTQWRYVTGDGTVHHAKPKSAWTDEWREQGIAFRWSLLYEQQTYAVGDWGQGFTTVKLPPGTTFDLQYSWQQGRKTHHRVIRGMRCAPAELPAS